jgi:UDP-N-acetylmuramate--L-alanine ligase
MNRWHFSGIGGSGMSAIAFYLRGRGREVSGSDRLFDQGCGQSIRAALEESGARIHPQDGSALDAGTVLVVSTAVESDVPEVRRARELGCRILHRSEALAELSAAQSTIAISGTSGKSTVTAMVFSILREAGLDPSVVSGAVLRELSAAGHWGNAWGGAGKWLVIEADESDGSLVRYSPEIGVMLNLDRDHKELSELREIFSTFRERSKVFLVHGDRPECVEIGGPAARTFGFTRSVLPLPQDMVLGADFVSFRLGSVPFRIPFPGRHTVENALAALAAAHLAGADLEAGARALAAFQGVGRRHELVGKARGVAVFDDFGHNPAKVEAALEAAHAVAGNGRVLAIFQPHGYGPLKFLLEDFASSFARALKPGDDFWISPVYDAGGTADRSVSSRDLADKIRALGHEVRCPGTRAEVAAQVAAQARPGDVVYSMGARDPELPAFAKSLLESIAARKE